MKKRVKILFHDHCFDGATSAALFSRFYVEKIDSNVTFEFDGVSHKVGDVYDADSFSGDVNAVVDFRYSQSARLDWWFDHHASGFPTPDDAAQFAANPSARKFYDPQARSCAKFLADTCGQRFGWDAGAHRELIRWADIIDGAQFESAKVAVELAEPALQLMTWVEANRDGALKLRFIDDLLTRPLAAIAQESYVTATLAPVLAAHARAIDVYRARGQLSHGVVHVDVADDGLDSANKFIPYFLFPDCSYVVVVAEMRGKAKVSVGFNPWTKAERRHSIAEICERYGGGGHPFVGAVSLGRGDLARARKIAEEIVEELRR